MLRAILNLIILEQKFNSDGIVQWGVQNLIPILLLFVGIGIIAGARKGQMSQNAMTITNVLLGCMLIAGAPSSTGSPTTSRRSSSRAEPCCCVLTTRSIGSTRCGWVLGE